jgi:hypothetical protein
MHSKDRLAAALEQIGLAQMARQAAQGYYHDALSPLPTPAMQLASDLAAVGGQRAMMLRNRVIGGEFDAPSSEWESETADDEDD